MWRGRLAVQLFWYFWVYRDNEAETLSELSAHVNTVRGCVGKSIFSERRSMLRHYKGSEIEVRVCEF
jgi:hypothetical protein